MGSPILDEKVALKQQENNKNVQACIEVQTHSTGIDFHKEQTENTNNPSSNLDKNKLQEEGRGYIKRM